jgi:hypothetical protein
MSSGTSVKLHINCLVLGDSEDSSRVAPVDILDSETVAALKHAIRIRKSPDLDNFSADALHIYRVSLPDNNDLPVTLQNFRALHDPDNGVHHLASPMKQLKSVLGRLLDEHIHILVLRPLNGE